jgi:hypothetical protein
LNRFVHNVDLDYYRLHHVTSIDDISTLCLICNESVQLTQKSMEVHLRSAHSMSLMNYEEEVSQSLFCHLVSSLTTYMRASMTWPDMAFDVSQRLGKAR